MQLIGKWQTISGLTATVREKIPKLRQYFGTVREKGKEHETIWYDSGVNAEFPEWDLGVKLDADTSKPRST